MTRKLFLTWMTPRVAEVGRLSANAKMVTQFFCPKNTFFLSPSLPKSVKIATNLGIATKERMLGLKIFRTNPSCRRVRATSNPVSRWHKGFQNYKSLKSQGGQVGNFHKIGWHLLFSACWGECPRGDRLRGITFMRAIPVLPREREQFPKH